MNHSVASFWTLVFNKCSFEEFFLRSETCNSLYFYNTTSSYVSLQHKISLKSLGYICSNNQQYIVWVKIIHFSFMPKIIRILRSCSMKIFSEFPTVNISKLNAISNMHC